MSLWSRISNAVRGERLNREIDEELQAHIDEAIASGPIPRKRAGPSARCCVSVRRVIGSALRAGSSRSWLTRISAGANSGVTKLLLPSQCYHLVWPWVRVLVHFG